MAAESIRCFSAMYFLHCYHVYMIISIASYLVIHFTLALFICSSPDSKFSFSMKIHEHRMLMLVPFTTEFSCMLLGICYDKHFLTLLRLGFLVIRCDLITGKKKGDIENILFFHIKHTSSTIHRDYRNIS